MSNKGAPLSSAVEDYLKAIYQLQMHQATVTTTSLAKTLGISAASATNMIKKLAALKLVRHSPYRGVTLTTPGEKIALEILRHHRLIELFLNETLGIPWDEVHDEAHKLEHVLSENLEDHISALLGHPTTDPHGDPIPTKAGTIDESAHQPLGDLTPGTRATIRRVSDQDPEHLRYFSDLGLVPNASVLIIERGAFGGPMRVQVGSGPKRLLDAALARAILVTAMPGRGEAGSAEKMKKSRRRRASTGT